MKRTRLNRYSLKKIKEMQDESPIRIELCKRAGGIPVTSEATIYRNGEKYSYTKVRCSGGICECGRPDCPKRPQFGECLEPHELVFRSHGGTLSLSNSRMVLRVCHRKLQNNEPMWSG